MNLIVNSNLYLTIKFYLHLVNEVVNIRSAGAVVVIAKRARRGAMRSDV